MENRRTKIRAAKFDDIRYCPTNDNPADLLTRGINTEQLRNSTLWWNGPKWLITKSNPTWDGLPDTNIKVAANAIIGRALPTIPEENDVSVSDIVAEEEVYDVTKIVDVKRFSSLRKLLKVSVFVLRFIRQFRNKISEKQLGSDLPRSDQSTDRRPDPPTIEELNEVKRLWFIHVQTDNFPNEQKSVGTRKQTCLSRQLKLFLDNGVLRKGGRLANADITDECKHPVLLPQNSHFTDILIWDTHRNTLHSGVANTTNTLKQSYFIPQILNKVRRLLKSCVTCNRVNAQSYKMPTSPTLPKFRVDSSFPAFHATGVDYTGEVTVKGDAGPKKIYIVLFTCATTRGIHLDYVPDLTPQSLIFLCMYSFIVIYIHDRYQYIMKWVMVCELNVTSI